MSRMLHLTENPWSTVIYMTLKRKELAFEVSRSSSREPPLFEDRYIRLTEPIVTLEYLEDRHPEPRIFPVDPTLKAGMRCLIRYFEKNNQAQCLEWIERRSAEPCTTRPSTQPR